MVDFRIRSHQSWGSPLEPDKKPSDTPLSLFILPSEAMSSPGEGSGDQLSNLHYLIRDTALQPSRELRGLIAASMVDDRGVKHMGSRKNKAGSMDADEQVNPAIEEFAETFIKNLKDQPTNHLEPFEAYAKRVEEDIFSSSKLFKERFEKGYRAILEELKKQSNS